MTGFPLMSPVRRGAKIALALTTLVLLAGCQHHEHMMGLQAQASKDAVHRVHMLVGEAVALVVDGSNLQLAADMGTSPPTDTLLRDTGTSLVERGEDLLGEIESTVADETPEDPEANPDFVYTRDLVAAAKEFTRQAGALRQSADSPHAHDPAMHHAHLLINNAVTMAFGGSDGVMLANMGLSGDLGTTVRETGTGLLSRSGELVHESMMQAMGGMAEPPGDSLHGYAQSASALIAKLSEMASAEHGATHDGAAHGGDHSGGHNGHPGH